MIASFRCQTSIATSRPGFHPIRGAGSFGFLAVLGFMVACGSSSSTPADGGAATGGSGSGGGVGTGGAAATIDAGSDARRGTGGAGGSSTAGAVLGKACTSDFDCAVSYVCLKADEIKYFDAAGPAHGYCSIPCSGMADPKCGSIGGVCQDLSPKSDGSRAYCFQTCTFGSPPEGKCQGRLDVGCALNDPTNLTSTAGTCQPACSSTTDCPADRDCEYGLCVLQGILVPRDPIGAHCSAPGATDTCAGSTLCLTVPAASGDKTFCSELCVVGSPTACNIASQSTSIATGSHGVCLPSSLDSTSGDVGFCFQQCDAASNCLDQTDTGLTCNVAVPNLPHGFCDWN